MCTVMVKEKKPIWKQLTFILTYIFYYKGMTLNIKHEAYTVKMILIKHKYVIFEDFPQII